MQKCQCLSVRIKEKWSLSAATLSGRSPVLNSPTRTPFVPHRTSLPAPMFSRSDFSVWTILKKCVGLVSPGAHAHAWGCTTDSWEGIAVLVI